MASFDDAFQDYTRAITYRDKYPASYNRIKYLWESRDTAGHDSRNFEEALFIANNDRKLIRSLARYWQKLEEQERKEFNERAMRVEAMTNFKQSS